MPAPPPRSLTAAQQFYTLRMNPIAAGHGTLRAGRLIWEFEASPSPLSRRYAARLDYRQGQTPAVYIDSPDLNALADGRRLPHVYEQKPPRLCLYLPRTGEWNPSLALDRTIVPWTSLWLFYFEDWLATGEWNGGGVHPDVPARRRRSRARLSERPSPHSENAEPPR